MPTLIVTNDFPPRIGGIESFVLDVCFLLDGDVVVLTSRSQGWEQFDAQLPFAVVRAGPLLLPTQQTRCRAEQLLQQSGATSVIFGATAPLGLLAGPLRRKGAQRLIGLTHGHETWWAQVPGARQALRHAATNLDGLSVISDFAATRIAPALFPADRNKIFRLPPPVDLSAFRPSTTPTVDQPRCIAVGRFVRQKGFDVLLKAWQRVIAQWAGDELPELVLVGDGPQRGSLLDLIEKLGLANCVRLTGPLSRADVVRELQRAQVFALPVRTRFWGLNPEGLGLVFVEAAATGLPVIAGRSGGVSETLREGESGFLVDPLDIAELAGRVVELLSEPSKARDMGAAGRSFVADRFGMPVARQALRSELGLST